MYRRGIVVALDPKTARVRCQFPERDGLVSWWLDVVRDKSRGDKTYWMPDLGEYVACIMDEHDEAGAVLGAIYSSEDPPPIDDPDKRHTVFKDGAVIEYDRKAHELLIDLTAAGGTLRIKTGTSEILMTPTNLFLRADRIDWNDDR